MTRPVPIRLAALQLGSDPGGTAATLEKILAYRDDINDAGCDLLVMPEALLGGYPKGMDFGARVGYRTERGRDEFLDYWQQSIVIDGDDPGPEISALCTLAKECRTSIVTGVIERDAATLYCTAVFISDHGVIAGKHRKLVPTASERLIWGRGDGSTLPVIETRAGRTCAVICWENYMPLLRTAMYAEDVAIWCAPTVDDRAIWQTSMQHIAYEGRQFLITACQYQPSPDELGLNGSETPDNWPSDRALIDGGSMIVSPMGEIIAGPLRHCEGLITADVDMNDIIRARFDLDTTGHYARPDVFTLRVNRGNQFDDTHAPTPSQDSDNSND